MSWSEHKETLESLQNNEGIFIKKRHRDAAEVALNRISGLERRAEEAKKEAAKTDKVLKNALDTNRKISDAYKALDEKNKANDAGAKERATYQDKLREQLEDWRAKALRVDAVQQELQELRSELGDVQKIFSLKEQEYVENINKLSEALLEKDNEIKLKQEVNAKLDVENTTLATRTVTAEGKLNEIKALLHEELPEADFYEPIN